MTSYGHSLGLAAIACAIALGCGGRDAAPPPPPVVPAVAPPPVPPDPLRCELALHVEGVGEGAGDVSAPVFVDDGALFAYLDFDGSASSIVVRRASLAGELGPEQIIARGDPISAPQLVAYDGHAAVLVSTGGATRLVPLDRMGAIDASATALTLSRWPESLALGPRGVVALPYGAGGIERIGRDGVALPLVPLPASPMMPEPQEELVASGAVVDAVLRRSGTFEAPVIDAHFLGGGIVTGYEAIGRDAGASVAAGPAGFLVVVSAPEDASHDLALHFFDASGTLHGGVVHLPGPTVRQYARVAALGDGWAITFWDGMGPTLLRVDAAGQALGPPVPVRSGDERGGHTDARMAIRDGTIAITWNVIGPMYGHGGPEERPPHPGPHIAIARCAAQ